jgi:recombination protein RecT
MAANLKSKLDQAAQTQALATRAPASTVLSVFQDAAVKARLGVALNSHPALSLDRFMLVAGTECSRNPRLLQCTRGSFLQALEMSAHLGLEVGGPLGHFYLVPFKNNKRGGQLEVVPILGYKGIIVLARRSGQISDIAARAVYAEDYFEWEYGLEDGLVHRPAMGKERGELVAFYGIARFTNGGRQMLVMSKAEVDSFRGRSRASDDGPWKTDYAAMGAKTVIRRMAPFLPLTVEAATAIADDEERELGLGPENVADLSSFTDAESKDEPKSATSQEGQGEGAQPATNPVPPATAAAEGGGATATGPAPDNTPSAAPSDAPKTDDPGAAFRR